MKTNPPHSPSNTNKDQECSFREIKKLIESTSASIEKRLDSVELRNKNQHEEELTDLVRKVEITATKEVGCKMRDRGEGGKEDCKMQNFQNTVGLCFLVEF